MRIYLSDYDVFVDEEARQYIEMNNVLKFNQIAVETKKIEAIIERIKNEYYYTDDEGEECGCFDIVEMLEDLK